MKEVIRDVATALKNEGVPRLHYLRGVAVYSGSDGEHSLIATAFFPATEEYPTVLDRSKRTERNQPHVNVTDALHAVWNAAHLVANRAGLTDRSLRRRVVNELRSKVLMPNTPYQLKTVCKFGREFEIDGKKYQSGSLEAQYFDQEGRELTKVITNWVDKPYATGD